MTTPLYNTLLECQQVAQGGRPVVRCPKCDAEIDVDEDEVEEGEILSCSECDAEMEVIQVHPVKLNVISEEDEDDDEEEEGSLKKDKEELGELEEEEEEE
ncbi:MAG: hypothetical protein ACRD50_02735 [Candidatus Acidiferrales bacterium]